MREAILKDISNKLEAIIAILIISTMKENTLREKIEMLSSVGLSTAQIATILKKKPGYISKEISTIKKKTK